MRNFVNKKHSPINKIELDFDYEMFKQLHKI